MNRQEIIVSQSEDLLEDSPDFATGRAGKLYITERVEWAGAFFTQSLMTWEGASETDVLLIGEP